ncbi:nitric oxide reductase activation protein NorD [Parapusillimonas granuli]|uniref:VWA domain-containing protein n=1 Tax=Parapusillimonas granuli TaxID=380911 RepID=A0A853G4I8_9BURK|nr:VWA domain-containing protein [Parapusillimonas granuli]MBB5217560.1 nitric oxide reductase NorD protein [Parapusillimonas granuli]NYT51813.1 VWA domain-containing protein [Parapusillimonas granuli]
MAEAEDVITDAARHATIYARDLWQRHRGKAAGPQASTLADLAHRLDLLIAAVFGKHYPLRTAQPPAIPSLLLKIFRRQDVTPSREALPATDGISIWLPADPQTTDHGIAADRYRCQALRQAMRAERGSPALAAHDPDPRVRALYLILEAQACDQELARILPGMAASLNELKRRALRARPDPRHHPAACRQLEQWLQRTLAVPVHSAPNAAPAQGLPACSNPKEALDLARQLVAEWSDSQADKPPHTHALVKDWWTGELIDHEATAPAAPGGPAGHEQDENRDRRPRSARMLRRPKQRQAKEDEDDDKPGVWMVQTNAPLEQAEDPMGMQRPADRDEQTPADEFADALSELPEARLVATPGKPKEVLISDDPPDQRAKLPPAKTPALRQLLTYPEWDYRLNGYRHPGALVHLLTAEPGPQAWIDATLAGYRSMLDTIRKRFEILRAERRWLRRQFDGDDIDLDACTDAAAEARAGLPMPQALYRRQSPQTRDMAITLLVDISGSTDSWLATSKRIIDVEREALLLVAIALESMGEPYSILAFSGPGAPNVSIYPIKSFTEAYDNDIARRIAGLEPQYYTRAGGALRHATAELMKQQVQHRLLLLLSDGKPNDEDHYEGRYGVEDMRSAVHEAKAQGIFPFCLTIDRQAAAYLPRVFGERQYALLSRPEALPVVLLDWMKRLVSR